METPTMTHAPADILDTLNALLGAEESSIIRYVGPASPYLTRATAHLRQDIGDWIAGADRREQELAELIDRLGGFPGPRVLQPEEQYMAYLSLRYLLPKLVDAQQQLLQRYQDALAHLHQQHTPPEVLDLIQRLRDEHAGHLQTARTAVDQVLNEPSSNPV